MPGKTGRFRGHAFHQVTVADNGISEVVDDLEPRPVVARRQMSLGDRHADTVAEALTQGTGGRFHAWRHLTFGMAGGAASPLAKLLDLFERDVIAGKIEHAVKQHRSVACRKDAAITVRPGRIARIVSEEASP